MAGYRDTLNLPRTGFPMKADLARREPDLLRFWDQGRFYERLRRERAGNRVRLLHDGPPYSNNHLHMGTAANKVWKDAVVRVANLLGYDSPYLPGWDNHGMPIETQVSREFRQSQVVPDRVTLRRRCREYAREWVGIQRDEFRRLGIWGDWERPYLTMDYGFEAAILEAFGRLADQGFVQRGLRSIHWCPTDRTALAEAEIEYHDIESPSIHVAFPLSEDPRGVLGGLKDVVAVAWTTTPWTLPANLGLMVDPAAEYAVVGAGGRHYLVSAARRAAVAEALGWGAAPVARTLRGRDLIGLVFRGPWGGPSRVVDGSPFVTLDEGTGLVHTAPGHGKEDFQVGQRSGLGVVCPVDTGGLFTAGAEPFVGRSVLEVDEDVIALLKERGLLLARGRLSHSYPHCWRCQRPVIFRATEQWFMIVDHETERQGRRESHRARCLRAIESEVRWDPPSSLNRIRESVRNRPDWCLSRQRSWGVGIPAVYCKTCGQAVLDPGVIARVVERTRERGSDSWFEDPLQHFLPPGFACPACGAAGPFERETDILDVWFDSGSTHQAVRRTHPDLAETWRRALAEGGEVLYFEGPDQHRGWFNSSLMVSVGVDGRPPYTQVLTHGWVLDAEGKAMHKSLGNVVHPFEVVERSGADILRWWALATDWRSDVRVGSEILARVSEAYRKVRNTFRFLLGNLEDFTPAHALESVKLDRVDQAFLEHFAAAIVAVRDHYDAGQFHRAVDRLLELCTVDLSAVFLDLTKDRLYTLAPDDRGRRSAQTVLWAALHDLAIAFSPVLVFTSEEVWQSHPALKAEHPSVHLATWPKPGLDPQEIEWDMLLRLRDAVNAALEPLRASKLLNTTTEAEVTLQVGGGAADRVRLYQDELPGFLQVADVKIVAAGGPDVEFRAEARRTAATKCERCWRFVSDVGTVASHPDLCVRCVQVMASRAAGTGSV